TGAPLPATGNGGAVFIPAGSGGLVSPAGLTLGPDGKLYVSNQTGSSNDGVLTFNSASGAFTGAFVAVATPGALAFGPDGNLYVSSTGNNQVIRYQGDTGAVIDHFGSGSVVNQPTFLAFLRSFTFDGGGGSNQVLAVADVDYSLTDKSLTIPGNSTLALKNV